MSLLPSLTTAFHPLLTGIQLLSTHTHIAVQRTQSIHSTSPGLCPLPLDQHCYAIRRIYHLNIYRASMHFAIMYCIYNRTSSIPEWWNKPNFHIRSV